MIRLSLQEICEHSPYEVIFRLNPNALLYICDTSDHREEVRNRLFLNWFKHHDMANRFYIRTAQANVEEEGFYAAVIVERSNLKAADVIADFEETAAMLTHGK